jgi:exopolysaccharide biosynthesis polyprenyl glycosylphosphotransferase
LNAVNGGVLDHAKGERRLSRSALRSSSGEARRNGARPHTPLRADELERRLLQSVDDETLKLIQRRRQARRSKDRGWLLRRLLLAGDLLGLSLAFLFASVAAEPRWAVGWTGLAIFLASFPAWTVAAKLLGLYDDDEAEADHTTLDDLSRIFLLVTTGAFGFAVVTSYTNLHIGQLLLFWIAGIVCVAVGRAAARVVSRRTLTYLQNAVIVGAGDVGQHIGRKLLQHPEYGINLVGFVDAEPKERQPALGELTLLGTPEELPDIVSLLGIQRVIIAFSRDDPKGMLDIVRVLRKFNVRIDIVPRLFGVVGPNAEVHALETMPMVGLPPARLGRSSLLLKRVVDVVGSALLLIITAPLFAAFAWKIKRDSPGPVFFKQQRLGLDQREFTVLKFRTMHLDAGDGPHREYIKATMANGGDPSSNGLFKLERTRDMTRFGKWLRKTSLDELPQLINVLRGEMSLVGPRPCLPYEIEHFAPHHFERFLVPAGVTGLWQVSARAHADFGEALDMDVLYARSWSLALDVRLLLKTPLQLLRSAATI